MAEEPRADCASPASEAAQCSASNAAPPLPSPAPTNSSAAAAAFDAAMHNAARNGDVAAIQSLAAADKSTVNAVDKLQRTPLHMACWAGCVAAAEKLIQLGADVDAPAMDAMTPLMFASQNNHAGIIQLLAKSGACLDAQDSKKRSSALHIAASKCHTDAVNTLLQCGANASVRNKAGQTAGDCAADSKLKQLLPRSKAALSRARAERKEAAAQAGDCGGEAGAEGGVKREGAQAGCKRPAVSFDEGEEE
jgi:ankyrin repeat protein